MKDERRCLTNGRTLSPLQDSIHNLKLQALRQVAMLNKTINWGHKGDKKCHEHRITIVSQPWNLIEYFEAKRAHNT